MDTKQEIKNSLKDIIKDLVGIEINPIVEAPANRGFGDYSTNAAMIIAKEKKESPMEIAEKIKEKYDAVNIKKMHPDIEKVEILSPGFINFWLSKNLLITNLSKVLRNKEIDFKAQNEISESKENGRKIIVEYAHPNTHKEMHIGHMRTLITGEAIARILQALGNHVFRANYQGDIGPHVAKALYGIQKIMSEEKLSISEIEKWESEKKAHFLGQGYVRGNQDYETHKEEIDGINSKLYELIENSNLQFSNSKQISNSNDQSLKNLYLTTRQWSLDYYQQFYNRFYTKFDRLFFESEMASCGKETVLQNLNKVFEKDQDAVIFPGEKYNLHRRVFITAQGYPTYEGKEMCLGFKEHSAFPFDLKIHVVASEQTGYFKVVFKALELIDPSKFVGKQKHIPMGMVQLTDRKMSSRTGVVLTVDWLINQVKSKVEALVTSEKIKKEEREDLQEQVTIGAIKYSVLKVNTQVNVAFDIEKSVSLEGNSGPYLQYTYARTRSVLAKVNKDVILNLFQDLDRFRNEFGMTKEEASLLRLIYQFKEVVEEAGFKLSPNIIGNYLYELSSEFNLFYQKNPILKSDKEDLRLALTSGVSLVLKQGLDLLGIKAPEKM